ncbi:MAG: tetraacyldisaccharide 4'-kinase [Burkholderiales bacterium]|nr:tetraacyldisaccharide 4'-kinase [Burkholderiales bacterium]
MAPPPDGAFEQRLTAAWLRRGLLAWALLPLAGVYLPLTALRRLLYRLGLLRSQRLPVPVCVVGNRVAGGAGKTPTTIAIVRHLQSRGLRVGVVSRGHGRKGASPLRVGSDSRAQDVGDEPLLIARRTGAPVLVARDRVQAGRELLRQEPQLDLIVCDDGLQHLRLARDVDILVFDDRGAGNGWPLPAGPLREPVGWRGWAPRLLVLYNAAHPTTRLPGTLGRRRLGQLVPLADWWAGRPGIAVDQWRPAGAQRPWALAGIAVPQRFFDQLERAGIAVRGLPLPDHADLATLPWPAEATELIVTEKDAVKLDPADVAARRPATRVWVATLDFEPDPAFWCDLHAALPQPLRERLRQAR